MRNSWTWTGTWTAAAIAVIAFAIPFRAGRAGDEGDPAAAFERLERDFGTTEWSWKDAYQVFEFKYKEFLAAHPAGELALRAKLRLIQFTTRAEGDSAAQQRAGRLADEILAEFAQSPRLAELYDLEQAFTATKFSAIATALSDPSRDPAVHAMRMLREGERLVLGRNSSDEDRAAGRRMLAALLAKPFADLPSCNTTFAQRADAILAPATDGDLVAGKPAPAIVGKSVDGKTIRLSDYLGKVVVVDFFGDW